MTKAEKLAVIGWMATLPVYVTVFLLVHGYSAANEATLYALAPFHVAVAVWGVLIHAIAVRDLFIRRFSDANAKLKWCLAILFGCGLGVYVYVLVHGLRPRTMLTESSGAMGCGDLQQNQPPNGRPDPDAPAPTSDDDN